MPPAKKTTAKKTAAAGRPRKLEIDPELQGRIMAMVRAGAFPERAAVAAGVSERSHYAWQAKGIEEREHRDAGKKPRQTMQIFLDYVDALDQAIAQAEMLLVGKIVDGSANAMDLRWMLERRFRDRWSTKQPPSMKTVAAPIAATNVTPLQQMAVRREQRQRVKKTS